MKKLVLVYVILIIAVILLAVVKAGGNFNLPLPHFGATPQAVIGKQTFDLTVVSKEEDLEKGLGGRKSLPQNQGMLFMFSQKSYPPFWMKGMLFSIDIIFIDDNKVVTVVKNAPSSIQVPNLTKYYPDQPINRVLEINAGLSDKYGIQKGTVITFKNVKDLPTPTPSKK